MWERWRGSQTLQLLLLLVSAGCACAANETVVTIGGLLAFNSTIGIAAKASLELAVSDINRAGILSPSNGTRLVLSLGNTNCSAFQGASTAMNLLKEEVVAIVGPQTSVVTHFVSHMGTATHIPLVSFSATDPSLSEDQYPYFVRLCHSDSVQMTAIAGVIQYYGWREVVALYVDDDFGNNGIDALEYALQGVGTSTVYKASLSPTIDSRGISDMLTTLSQMESRVFVVHMQPDIGRQVFLVAEQLQMVTTGYVWIVTESISSIMDNLDTDVQDAVQGVIGTRSYIPSTSLLQGYRDRWVEFHKNDSTIGSAQMNNVYALFAYDALWLIAHAIRNFSNLGGATTFVNPVSYPSDAGGGSELAQLKVFRDGQRLMNDLLGYNFTGITGPVQVDQRGELLGSSFEIVNMVGKGLRSVGFWSNSTGILSSVPASNVTSNAISRASSQSANASLQTVIWPGGGTTVPRGWVVPRNGQPLVIGVPNKVGYKEFVSSSVDAENHTAFTGFCIDVFQQAVALLPYSLSYNYELYGNGTITPSYDDMIDLIVDGVFDAVVGDVTITTQRSTIVDFTQPYTTSGLVVVVPVKQVGGTYAWAFLRPFTPLMWVTTGLFFFFTGLVVWFLEHKKNRDFRGRPKKQAVTTLWFIFSTLFFSQREDVKSTLGRAVLIIWLFVVLIVISSYTASLTSILTVQQLTTTISGISSLLASSVQIGYQTGSFVEDYLIQLNVAKDRLVPLDTVSDYAAALAKGSGPGGVGAIVDELPYVQLFLSEDCSYSIAGQEFSQSGWGFAFPKGSQLVIDISTAILELSESGQLQKIHDNWLSSSSCSSSSVSTDSNELGLGTFWGLFLISGLASVLCILIYWTRMILLHRKMNRGRIVDERQQMSSLAKSKSFLRSLVLFIEEEETEETRRNRRSRKSGRKGNKTPEFEGASPRSFHHSSKHMKASHCNCTLNNGTTSEPGSTREVSPVTDQVATKSLESLVEPREVLPVAQQAAENSSDHRDHPSNQLHCAPDEEECAGRSQAQRYKMRVSMGQVHMSNNITEDTSVDVSDEYTRRLMSELHTPIGSSEYVTANEKSFGNRTQHSTACGPSSDFESSSSKDDPNEE